MSDSILAFVSDNGHVIGIGKVDSTTMLPEGGLAMAILEEPVTLHIWTSILESVQGNPYEAAILMLNKYGGSAISKEIDLTETINIPMWNTVVGEA
jgi:hypothetical protein